MRVSKITQLNIKNIILPTKVEGSYWIDGTDENGISKNLISIEAYEGRWRLVSNDEVFCVINNEKVPSVYLENNVFYTINNKTNNDSFILFCSPIVPSYNCYDIEDELHNELKIGSNNSLIEYSYLDPENAIIKYVDNKVSIMAYRSNYGVYVNNVRVMGSTILNIGDVIFINGLKMILSLSSDNRHCVYINNGTLANIQVKLELVKNNLPINNNFTETNQEIEFPLYEEKDYFHKTPRFFEKEKPLVLQIDPPPAVDNSEGSPLILTIGPMITMSMTSMVTGYTALNNVLNGQTTWASAAPSLVICGAMFASVFLWPLFTKWYEKKMKIQNEELRQKKYSEYIEEKRRVIVSAIKEQTSILKNNYMSSEEASETIIGMFTKLWQRRVNDEDFLEVNLGDGTYPMNIDIKYPEEHFSMAEDNLKDMALKLGQDPKLLVNVPVVLSLRDNFINGIIGDIQINEFTRRLLIQLLALHSYDNLKIVFLTDSEKEYEWESFKYAPHTFTSDKSLRFFATNNDEYKEVCYYLDKIFDYRKEKTGNNEPKKGDFNENYLIITDCFKKIRNFDIIKDLLENNYYYYGFSLLILESKITNLPDQCSSFVNVNKDFGELRNNQNINECKRFIINNKKSINYDDCISILANIPIEITKDDDNKIVNKIGFLEMYDVGKIEQLNSMVRWQKNNPILNLQVPVGLGKSGEKITIDLHEKYHGPHGLIAGMTGSGKSEFIITYILSMAINYHPYEVQFILIDYKGGGLAGAFENNNIGLKLPHLVGTITNLDANEIKRSLSSIESELKRRQTLFNKARETSGDSTIDIYKYQKMYRDGIVKEPISHLFIISDEFAELKNQQPEFMEQLISTARIGRSLGVHLILATQKPSGVVDPQIWSNTRFRVCMKVQDKSDSNEVIKCPDAAYLKQTGRFYFQVGYNEVFLLGQAAYAGGKYIPSEKVAKTINSSMDFINNIGYNIKNVETKPKVEVVNVDLGEELTNIVKYLDNLAKSQNIKCKPLWLEKIPNDIRVNDLALKYNYQKENYIINPIIGEYDIPTRQEQKLLTLPLTKEGNALIYGATGSGKENFITTLVYASSLYYSPDELNFYIIDFGSETLRMFSEYPIVGDILNVNDDEKIRNLYKMLNTEIEKRKTLFADYNGNYITYSTNSGKHIPSIVVIINNYESYQETYSEFDDTLNVLSRESSRYGIFFVLTVNTPNGLRFKLRQNFSLIYTLQQNNEEDYVTILGNVHKNYPAKVFGRGIFKIDNVYEFQTAFSYEKDNITKHIKEFGEELKLKYKKAKQVPILPTKVGYNEVAKEIGKTNSLVIGINKSNLNISKFNFIKNYITMVTSQDLNILSSFMNPLINQIILNNHESLIVINAEDFNIVDDYKKYYTYLNKNFDEMINKLSSLVSSQKQSYIDNDYDKSIFNNTKKIYCIIIGIDSLKNRLNEESKNKLSDLFNGGNGLETINFILVDTIDKIKKIELEPWYKNSVHNNYGIWIGNGINDQFSLKVVEKIAEMKEDVPDEFCFVVKRGKVEYVKYVTKLDLKIK